MIHPRIERTLRFLIPVVYIIVRLVSIIFDPRPYLWWYLVIDLAVVITLNRLFKVNYE